MSLMILIDLEIEWLTAWLYRCSGRMKHRAPPGKFHRSCSKSERGLETILST